MIVARLCHTLSQTSKHTQVIRVINAVHERWNIVRERELVRQCRARLHKQPFAVHRRAATVKLIALLVNNKAFRVFKTIRTFSVVSVQPSDSLEQKVHRAKFGHHNVEIEVERLLEHLRSDDYQTAARIRRRILSDALQNQLLTVCALGHYELRVHHYNFAFRKLRAELFGDFLRLLHRVDDHSGASAAADRVSDTFYHPIPRDPLHSD